MKESRLKANRGNAAVNLAFTLEPPCLNTQTSLRIGTRGSLRSGRRDRAELLEQIRELILSY